MSEPTERVSTDQILAILGAKEVEIQLLRVQLSQALANVKELTPEPAKVE